MARYGCHWRRYQAAGSTRLLLNVRLLGRRAACRAWCRQYNLLNGESITADLYVSAMPVDIVKKLMPEPWGKMEFFRWAPVGASPRPAWPALLTEPGSLYK